LGCRNVCLTLSVRIPDKISCSKADLASRDIPIVFVAYFGWKYFKKTKIVSLDEIPLDAAFTQAEQADTVMQNADEPEKRPSWMRLVSWIWD